MGKRFFISLFILVVLSAAVQGQVVKRLTRTAADDDEPCFSPDGRWIVYQSRDISGRVELWIVGSDGAKPKRITGGAGYKCFPAFSPDGKRIVFASDPKRDWIPDTSKVSMGAYDLYAIDFRNGRWSKPKQLTDTPNVMEYLPSYSPDGKHIAYSCGLRESSRLGDVAIFIMDAEQPNIQLRQAGKGEVEGSAGSFRVMGRQLVTSEHGAIEPSFSRDGKTIAFTWSYLWENGHQMGICLADSSSERIHPDKSTRLKQLADFPHYAPAFSPKADLLAFVMSRGEGWDIWVLASPYTSEPIRLTNHPANDVNPTWSPDGRRIAFASNRNGNYNIYVTDVPQQVLTAGGQK